MRDLGAEAYRSYVKRCREVWNCPATSRESYEKNTQHIVSIPDARHQTPKAKDKKNAPSRHQKNLY